MTTTQTTETPERIFRLRTSLAEIAASQSDALGMRAVARAALAEDEALAASPGAVDAVRALEFVERIRRFAADADASDAVSAATALTYVERNAEALAALLAASTSDTALRAAAARLVACLDAITFSEGPEYAAADAPDRFRVIQIRPLETWRQSVRNLADLRALLASSPAPVLEPEHAGTLLGAPCPNCGSKLDTYCPDCAWPRPEPGFVSPAPEDPPAPATTTPEEPDLAQAAAEGYEAGVRDALRGDAPAELIAALSAAPAPDAHTETAGGRCGARPRQGNHGAGIFKCEALKGHAGAHRYGLNVWSEGER